MHTANKEQSPADTTQNFSPETFKIKNTCTLLMPEIDYAKVKDGRYHRREACVMLPISGWSEAVAFVSANHAHVKIR